MSTDATQEVQVAEAETKSAANMTPQEFLASLAGAPTVDQITTWKAQAPNNRIEVFTPDGKRAFILRGLTGLELTQIQKQIQAMATPTSDPDLEMQIASVVKANLWTNVGQNFKLNDVVLRTGSAGLPSSLFAIVTRLSDFMDPQQINLLSAEL